MKHAQLFGGALPYGQLRLPKHNEGGDYGPRLELDLSWEPCILKHPPGWDNGKARCHTPLDLTIARQGAIIPLTPKGASSG